MCNKRMRSLISSFACIIICLITVSFVKRLFLIAPGCEYSRLVRETTGAPYATAAYKDCRYCIENCEFKGDAYNLLYISGWEVTRKDDHFRRDASAILLKSDSCQYEITVYRAKRTDVYFVDQSKNHPDDPYVGFFTYIPEASIERGEYKVGIIIGNKNKRVVWSDLTVSFKSDRG